MLWRKSSPNAVFNYRRANQAPRGVALLIVLALLALLSLLAVSFVFESRLELRAAQSYTNTVSADEVASAGAQFGVQLLEEDKRLRLLGADNLPDTGDEIDYDSLFDAWATAGVAAVRVTYDADGQEDDLRIGQIIHVEDATPTLLATGVIVSVDRRDDAAPGPAVGAAANFGAINILTPNPQVWVAGNTVFTVRTGNTSFRQDIVVAITTAGNTVDLNNDAAGVRIGNTIDDDNDGTVDDDDEGNDAVWQNYYDGDGALVGRYAVLIEDENGKINANAVHNLALEVAVNNDPTDNTFTDGAGEGVSTAEISFERGAGTVSAVAGQQLVMYRHGVSMAELDPVAPVSLADILARYPQSLDTVDNDGDGNTDAADTDEDHGNRIYVAGQGLTESAAFSSRTADDDDSTRWYFENWDNARPTTGTVDSADDVVASDPDVCVDEFDEVLVFLGDGVDNDGDGCIDELDEGVNDPFEFRPGRPYFEQTQASTHYEQDLGDNDVDGTFNETSEGNDRVLTSLEDLVSLEGPNLGASPFVEDWLGVEINEATGNDPVTIRRNVLTVQSQDQNIDRFEQPRINPNFASAEELHVAAQSPSFRGLWSYREAEFRRLQAAINLHDYRDANLVRDEITDGAGNVFAGVEGIRINEIMVAPATRLYEGEEAGAGGNWVVVNGFGAGAANGAGSPRGVNTEQYLSTVTAATTSFSNAITVQVPNGVTPTAPENIPAFMDPAVATDNDGDCGAGPCQVRLLGAPFAAGDNVDEERPDDNDGVDGLPVTPLYDEDTGAGGLPADNDGDTANGEDTLAVLPGPVVDPDVDGFSLEDGSNGNGVSIADFTARFVIRSRTNNNAGIAPAGTAAADRGFMIFVNGEAIWPRGAPGTSRWGVPANLAAVAPASSRDGEWFVQDGVCHVVPGDNTVEFYKPPAGVGPDQIDIDWFYISFEPDAEWVELVNLSPEAVDISGWELSVEAVEDQDLEDTENRYVTVAHSLDVPAATTIPAATVAGPGYLVLSVDALGAGNQSGATNLTLNSLLDDERGDGSNFDTMAYDKLWYTATSATQNQSTNPVAIQFGGLAGTLYRPGSNVNASADGVDNDGDGNSALACGVDPLCDEADEEADDFFPFRDFFPNEPVNDPNDDIADQDHRNTGELPADPIDTDDNVTDNVDVATVSLTDGDGNLVDRVTYSATDVGWATNQVAGNRGFGVLKRKSPTYAGDRLAPNVDVTAGALAADTVTVDNFVLNLYNAADGVTTETAVLADGNYDDWAPLDDDPVPTPGRSNDRLFGTGVNSIRHRWETYAQVKNRHLSTVGELAMVPFGFSYPYYIVPVEMGVGNGVFTDVDDVDALSGLLGDDATDNTLTVQTADASNLNDLITGTDHLDAVFLRDQDPSTSEIMRVASVDTGTDTVTVVRGALGAMDAHIATADYDVLTVISGDTLQLDEDGLLRDPVTRAPETITAEANAAGTLLAGESTFDLTANYPADLPLPVLLRDITTPDSQELLMATRQNGVTLTVVRALEGVEEDHVISAVYQVLAGPEPRQEVATIRYQQVAGLADPTVADVLDDETQVPGGASRTVVAVDAAENLALVWDEDSADLWEVGDFLDNASDVNDPVDFRVSGIFEYGATDVGQLIDGLSTEAIILEAQEATEIAISTWADANVGNDDPAEYTIAAGVPVTAVVDGDLDLRWDPEDGVEDGVYHMYVFGQGDRKMDVTLLDATGTPMLGLQQLGKKATLDDHLIAFGEIEIPYDDDVGTSLRVRFEDAGADAGTISTRNRVSRVILAPPATTIGRINVNTAQDRVLLGLPLADEPNHATDNTPLAVLGAVPADHPELATRFITDRSLHGPYTSVADVMARDRELNPRNITNPEPNATGNDLRILADSADNDEDGFIDEMSEARDVFRRIANLTTVRSDVYKIIVIGQSGIDANNDGVIEDSEVRAERKLEFVYER